MLEISLLNTNFQPVPKVSLSTDPKFSAPISNVTAAVGREAILTCQVIDLGSYKVIHEKNKHNDGIMTIQCDPQSRISNFTFFENFFFGRSLTKNTKHYILLEYLAI